MTIVRAFVVGVALANLVGCSATIRLVVSNQMTDTVSVHYAGRSATIPRSNTETLIVPAVSLPLLVETGEDCAAFQLPLGQLPGEYYRLGIRHSVQISVVERQAIRIEPKDRENSDPIVVSAVDCDKITELPEDPNLPRTRGEV